MIDRKLSFIPQKDGKNMHLVLDWFTFEHFFEILLLAYILAFVGSRISADDAVHQRSVWFAAFAFLIYSTAAACLWRNWDATGMLIISLRALLAAAVAFGVGSIFFSLLFAIQMQLKSMRPTPVTPIWIEPPRKSIKEQMEQMEQERKSLPPPPLSIDEQVSQAQTRYRKRRQLIANAELGEMEEAAAMEKAQQSYLREIDEALS